MDISSSEIGECLDVIGTPIECVLFPLEATFSNIFNLNYNFFFFFSEWFMNVCIANAESAFADAKKEEKKLVWFSMYVKIKWNSIRRKTHAICPLFISKFSWCVRIITYLFIVKIILSVLFEISFKSKLIFYNSLCSLHTILFINK